MFSVSPGTCGASLEPGQACAIWVEVPSVPEGPSATVLSLGYFDGVEAKSIPLGLTVVGRKPLIHVALGHEDPEGRNSQIRVFDARNGAVVPSLWRSPRIP